MALTQVQGGMLQGSTNTTTTIQSNGTTAITIDSTQNVGIGTSSPLASPKVTISNNSTVTAGGDGGGNGLCVVGTTGTGAGAQLVVVGSDTAAIDKGGAITFGGKFNTGNNDFAQWARVAGYKENGTNTDFSGYLGFYTRPNNQGIFERMRVTSGGDLFLNTTATFSYANGKMCINADGSGNPGLVVGVNSTSSAYNNIVLGNSTGGVGRIQTNGSATSYLTSSDHRLKTDVTPIQNAIATIQRLNPVAFTWTVDSREDAGFLAHEFQEVLPNYADGTKDEVDAEGNPVYQAVDKSGAIPYLVKAIQELKAELDATKAEVAALKAAP